MAEEYDPNYNSSTVFDLPNTYMSNEDERRPVDSAQFFNEQLYPTGND